MDNSTIYAVITYLIIFRVAIILVGGVSIVLGYKLFVKGILLSGNDNPATSIEAKLGGYEISMKNAAPGTFFALFGSIVIGAMILSSPPEVKMEQRSSLPINSQQGESSTANIATDTISTLSARGGNTDTSNPEADALHREAWDHLNKALKAAKRAVELERTSERTSENNSELNNYLDTLAAISFIAEEDVNAKAKALKEMPNDAEFRQQLQKYCQSKSSC
jgi:hypothetical protein